MDENTYQPEDKPGIVRNVAAALADGTLNRRTLTQMEHRFRRGCKPKVHIKDAENKGYNRARIKMHLRKAKKGNEDSIRYIAKAPRRFLDKIEAREAATV